MARDIDITDEEFEVGLFKREIVDAFDSSDGEDLIYPIVAEEGYTRILQAERDSKFDADEDM